MSSSTKAKGFKLVSEALAIVFFASAVLQFNDDDLALWGSFYTFHVILALSSIFRFGSSPFGIGMSVWSVMMMALALSKWGDVVMQEELMGAVLGLLSGVYHTFIASPANGSKAKR